jgi:hypothetical protein
MERFVALSDAALLQRIDHLDRAEHQLHQSAMKRVSQGEADGRAVGADLQYQLLSAALKESREHMLRIEAELLRRSAYAIAEAA